MTLHPGGLAGEEKEGITFFLKGCVQWAHGREGCVSRPPASGARVWRLTETERVCSSVSGRLLSGSVSSGGRLALRLKEKRVVFLLG